MTRVVVALLLGAAGAAGQAPWASQKIPGLSWTDYTVAHPVGPDVVLLHGRTISVLRAGKVERIDRELPFPVDVTTATAVDRQGGVLVIGGQTGSGVRIDPKSWELETLPDADVVCGRGARLCIRGEDVFLAAGGGKSTFRIMRERRWFTLPGIVAVNPLGKWSSGLFSVPSGLLAFGDHHLAFFDAKTALWPPSRKITAIWGIRPVLGQGGMVCQDARTGNLYATLGRGARTVCALLTDQHPQHFFSYNLKPRLPIGLRFSGETLYITGESGARRLCLLLPDAGNLWSIPLSALTPIGIHDKHAEVGSPWLLWNALNMGTLGDLVRQHDSDCSIVSVPPYALELRKNVLRRFNVRTLVHSPTMVGARYGDRFARRGLALATDGKSTAWLCNGHDRRFWRVRMNAETIDGIPSVRPVDQFVVEPVSDLPEATPGNTALAYLSDGTLLALFDPKSRRLWRYRVDADTWTEVTRLPDTLPYTLDDGFDLLPTKGGEVIVVARDRVATWSAASGWSEIHDLGFRYTADGGMAAHDPITGHLHVIIGGGSRDRGIFDLSKHAGRLLVDDLPDTVSVHGRRTFVAAQHGKRHLFVYRGADSNEFWALPLSR